VTRLALRRWVVASAFEAVLPEALAIEHRPASLGSRGLFGGKERRLTTAGAPPSRPVKPQRLGKVQGNEARSTPGAQPRPAVEGDQVKGRENVPMALDPRDLVLPLRMLLIFITIMILIPIAIDQPFLPRSGPREAFIRSCRTGSP
jgi:hypothetical protein